MKIIAPVLMLVILMQLTMAVPTKPAIMSNSPVDLYLNKSIIINFTWSTDDENNTITYDFFEDGSLLYPGITDSLILSRSVGIYSFYICANTTRVILNETTNETWLVNAVNCSDVAQVSVIYSGLPVIGSIGEMSVTPYESDSNIAKRIFGITATDRNQVWMNASMTPADEDYYDGDEGNSSVILCAESVIIGETHYFNCTIEAKRGLQAGYYNIKVKSGSQYGSTEKVFNNKLVVNVLLSANITLPELDLNDYYNGWAQSSEPIWIRNTGNVAFSEFGIRTTGIECKSKTISTDDILLNYRMSKSSAVTCDPMSWFIKKVWRGESQELNVFVRNNLTVSNCKYVWDVIARWRE